MMQALGKADIAVIIPALDEEESIGLVVRDIPKELVSQVVVVNNGSVDDTGIIARMNSAVVIDEPEHGYGRACKAGIKYLENAPPSIVVFLDGDYSDYPGELSRLIQPIIEERADLVLGSRLRFQNSLSFHVAAANKFFSKLINLLYGVSLTDLGPFRAIKWDLLQRLNMTSDTYGWSCEMIVKAAKTKARIEEFPVRYRKRIGRSKISGSFRGSLKAFTHILYNILRYCT